MESNHAGGIQVHLGLSAEVSVSGSSHIVWKVLGKVYGLLRAHYLCQLTMCPSVAALFQIRPPSFRWTYIDFFCL